ncbi:MAG: hypothetical protein K2L87_04800 [Clostridiales bacterium]|nr:hypothetical protein [Clostridiales bacterium]
MIFFVGNDGTIIKSLPSPVYQGGANTNTIYLIAPFAENLSATVAFQLPNGVWTKPCLMSNGISNDEMTQQGALKSARGEIIDKDTGKTYSGWSYSLPNEITRYYGTVTAQFFFYANNVVTATSATSFTVGRGVPMDLDTPPDADIYKQILDELTLIRTDLTSGEFTARSFYPYNSDYSYGYNEIVYYPNEGNFGVFLKSLKQNNTDAPYLGDELSPSWQLITDFNILHEIMEAQQEVFVAKDEAYASAFRASAAENSAGRAAQNALQSAQAAQQAADRVKGLQADVEGILDGTTAVPKAIADSEGENIAEHFDEIESLIPSSTTPENPLTNEAFVNSSINNMAAFYITSDAEGAAFPTHAALTSATTFYSGGKTRVPTQNDYAIVLADETQPQGVDGNYPTTRYSYQGGAYPDGQWDFQYVVNNTSLTQAQVDAINSGITAQKIASMDAATAAKYTKPSGGIPEIDLSSGVQGKLNATSTGYRKNLYNLGLWDTVSTSDGVTATIARKTGYLTTNDLLKMPWTREQLSNVSTPSFYSPLPAGQKMAAVATNRFHSYTDGGPGLINGRPNAWVSGGGNLNIFPAVALATVADFLKWISENELIIQFPLSSEYQYTESAIVEQPIHTLNQEGEEWVRDEWEKSTNLLNGNIVQGSGAGRLCIRNSYIEEGNYIVDAPGMSTRFNIAVVVNSVAEAGYPSNDLYDSGWITADQLPKVLSLPAGYVGIRIRSVPEESITPSEFTGSVVLNQGKILRESNLQGTVTVGALNAAGAVSATSINADTLNGKTLGNAILRQSPTTGRVVIGSFARPTYIVGNGQRPVYSNKDAGVDAITGEYFALQSDIPVYHYFVIATSNGSAMFTLRLPRSQPIVNTLSAFISIFTTTSQPIYPEGFVLINGKYYRMLNMIVVKTTNAVSVNYIDTTGTLKSISVTSSGTTVSHTKFDF